jgi:hypothetical protein
MADPQPFAADRATQADFKDAFDRFSNLGARL